MAGTVATEYRRSKIHPQKFALYAACASIVMMFSALSSAYIVRQAAGNWLEFPLPSMFYVSTAVIILSSVALHFSYKGFVSGNAQQYKVLMLIAAFLGVAFLILQYQGWLALMEMGVPLRANPSGDFIYAISGLHAAHILGGLAALLIALIHAFGLKYKVTGARKLRFELTMIYWHFVDALWIYLFVFFLIQS